MSDLRVTNLRGRTAGSSPSLPDGAVVTGIVTATTAIVGSGVTVNATGINATGILTATTAVVGSGVTVNATGINATGILTATTAIVGSGVTVNATGINVAGVVTATSFSGSGANLTNLNIPASFVELDATLFG